MVPIVIVTSVVITNAASAFVVPVSINVKEPEVISVEVSKSVARVITQFVEPSPTVVTV